MDFESLNEIAKTAHTWTVPSIVLNLCRTPDAEPSPIDIVQEEEPTGKTKYGKPTNVSAFPAKISHSYCISVTFTHKTCLFTIIFHRQSYYGFQNNSTKTIRKQGSRSANF